MQVKVEGVKQTRKAIRLFAPDLSKALDKELRRVLAPITRKARGFVDSTAPLSGWAKGKWFPYVASEIKSGIGFSTKPGAVSKYGFTSNARIFNKSIAGAIYEQAHTPQPWVGAAAGGKSKGVSRSRNPNAGQQFIDAMPPLAETRKGKGRLIFKAWSQDQGKVSGAAIKAIDIATREFNKRAETTVFTRGAK